MARDVVWLAGLYAIVWGAPNTQQIMRHYAPALGRIKPGPLLAAMCWQPNLRWAAACGLRRRTWPDVDRRHRRISLLPVLTRCAAISPSRSQRCCCIGPRLDLGRCCATGLPGPGIPGLAGQGADARELRSWRAGGGWRLTRRGRHHPYSLADARHQPCRRRWLSDRGLHRCGIARTWVSDAATTRHRVIRRGAFHRAGPVLGTLGSLRIRRAIRTWPICNVYRSSSMTRVSTTCAVTDCLPTVEARSTRHTSRHSTSIAW